jgi:hypothetical protein
MNETKPVTKETIAKGIRLSVIAYMATIGATILVSFAIMLLMNPNQCSEYAQTMLVLWVMIAVLFLASATAVKVAAWKITPRVGQRWAILFVHGVALLGSYVVIAFGLLVAFNC